MGSLNYPFFIPAFISMPGFLLRSCLSLLFITTLSSQAETPENARSTPEATQRVLSYVLELSQHNLAANSSCRDFPGTRHRYRLADWLSMQLAYLQTGENSLRGYCEQDRCELKIQHNDGESVFSSQIRFRLKHHRPDPASLDCLTTP